MVDQTYNGSKAPKWIKSKKSTINSKSNGDNYYQYTITVALNLEQIKKGQQRITNICPFINQF